MFLRIAAMTMVAFTIQACSQRKSNDGSHEDHGGQKFLYVAYSQDFELFAEADPFVVGDSANVLSHFSTLPDFRALDEGTITLVLTVNGKTVKHKLEAPARKGIYSFNVMPLTSGKGSMHFSISRKGVIYQIDVPQVTVFSDREEALLAAANTVKPLTNTAVFTKEQSWKIDFCTDFPKNEPFGQVIKTIALIQPSPGSEMVVSARSSGIVMIDSKTLLEGKSVARGQVLLSISGKGLAENSSSVKFSETRSNYEKARANYQRIKELAEENIVSQKELIAARNEFETAKAEWDNLNISGNEGGQSVGSPLSGFIKQVFVENGSFVNQGQPLLVVAEDKSLILRAEVPLRHAGILGAIESANIRNPLDNRTYSAGDLDERVLSYGRSGNPGNPMIPVLLQIDNNGTFVPGSFVDVFLKCRTSQNALTVPVTSLLEEQGVFFVWVQVTPELFEKREVQIGATDGLRMEVVKGISTQDRIVTRGAMMIKLAQATGALDAHSGHVH